MKVYKVKNTHTNLYLRSGGNGWDAKGDVFRDATNMKKVLNANMPAYLRAVKKGNKEDMKRYEGGIRFWVIEEYECVLITSTNVIISRQDKIDTILAED